MLSSISISNFILIARLNLEFQSGLTALTGETGAGKSIILDALQTVFGERSTNKILKDKTKPASISAVFEIAKLSDLIEYLKEQGLLEDDTQHQLILRRVIAPDGKSKAFVNDIQVNLTTLNHIATYLVEICGQNDSKGLLNSNTHLQLLDSFAGINTDLLQLNKLFNEYRTLSTKYNDLCNKRQQSEFETTYLQTLLEELDNLDYQPNEENDLAEKKRLLTDSIKAKEALKKAIGIFEDEYVLRNLNILQKEISKFPDFFQTITNELDGAIIEIEEVYNNLATLEKQTPDSSQYQVIEERLFRIRSHAKKYNILPEQLHEYRILKQQELDSFAMLDEDIASTLKVINKLKAEYITLAKSLSQKRAESALKLSSKINSELQSLKMVNAEFKIELNTNVEPDAWTSKGIDQVKFLIRTNLDGNFDLINKVASGGELSRTMLAFKVAITNVKFLPLMIFDEIDIGISGAVADAVGKKLASLAKQYQIIVITHQPQVAAYSDHHLLVTKKEQNKTTVTEVLNLDAQAKQNEIARMLSGHNITAESIAAAKKLIQSAA